MMVKLKERHLELRVLRIDCAVLDIAEAIVTDRNAAKSICRFAPASAGLLHIDRDRVFAEDWRRLGDPIAYERHKAIKCAEVLVPNQVPPVYIIGAYVSCAMTAAAINTIAPSLPTFINGHLFFYEEVL